MTFHFSMIRLCPTLHIWTTGDIRKLYQRHSNYRINYHQYWFHYLPAPSGMMYERFSGSVIFSSPIQINSLAGNSTDNPLSVQFQSVGTPPLTNISAIHDDGNTFHQQIGATIVPITIFADGIAIRFEEMTPGDCWPEMPTVDCGFQMTPNEEICQGSTVSFLSNEQSGIHRWDFGNENAVIEGIVNPSFTFDTPGTFTITHLVEIDGWACSEQQTVTVYQATPVSVEPGQSSICSGQCVDLNIISSNITTEGSALYFDGINDFVGVSPIDLSFSKQMTIEAWVQPDDLTSTQYQEVLRQEGVTSPDWILSFQNFGTVLSFGVRTDGVHWELDAPINVADLVDGNWHHVAGVYDGSEMRIYVDFVLVATRAEDGYIDFTGIRQSIGNHPFLAEYFEGRIDEIRVWSIGRTLDELMQGAACKVEGSEPDLAAAWNLDEGSGTFVSDASPNGYHGALDGIPEWVISPVAPECCGSVVWTPATGLNNPYLHTPTACPEEDTEYTVSILDCVEGCVSTASATVSVLPGLSVDAGMDVAVLIDPFGTAPNPCVELFATVTGSIPPPYQYLWTPATGLSDPTYWNPGACPTVTTTYTVTVSRANGCEATDEVTVTVVNVRDRYLPLCEGSDTKVMVCYPGECDEICAEKFEPMSNPNSLAYHLANGATLGACSGCKTSSARVEIAPVRVEISPNPFLESSKITVNLGDEEYVDLQFVDLHGKQIYAPAHLELSEGTSQEITFRPEKVASGIYFLRVVAASGHNRVHKLVKY